MQGRSDRQSPEPGQPPLDGHCAWLEHAGHEACLHWLDCWTGGWLGTAGSDQLAQQSSSPCNPLHDTQKVDVNSLSTTCKLCTSSFVFAVFAC